MGLFDDMRETVAGMVAVADVTGHTGPRPKLWMTSGKRGGGPHHSEGRATDWGNDVGDAGSPELEAWAIYLGDTFGPYSLEVIHTFSGDRGGVYWKNGVQIASYGWDTNQAHRNHVHWAITQTGLDAVAAELPKVHFEPLDVADRMKIGAFQATIGTKPDFIWGPQTWAKAEQIRDYYNGHFDRKAGVVGKLQAMFGVTVDNVWGPQTDAAYLLWRYIFANK